MTFSKLHKIAISSTQELFQQDWQDASTFNRDASENERVAMDNLIRLSIGQEHGDDISGDIEQSLISTNSK